MGQAWLLQCSPDCGPWPIRKAWLEAERNSVRRHPILYSLPAGTVYDIGPVTSKTNVTGSIQDANGTTKYTAAQLASADPTEHQFVSAIWDIFTLEETAAVVSFGTDNGLHTNASWDNVTGVGTPNAKAFADVFFGK